MIKKYYDQDCNLGMLDGKTIAIIGFGSQGHAHAMNLNESGANVVVGLRPGSAHTAKAEAAGLKITGIESITEDGVYSYQNDVGNVYSRAAGMKAAAMEEDAGTVVQSAKLIVSAGVSITFEAE